MMDGERKEGVGAERNEAVGGVEFRPDGAAGGEVPPATEELEQQLLGVPEQEAEADNELGRALPLQRTAKGRRLVKRESARGVKIEPGQKLLLLDTWKRSGLPMGEFEKLVGISKHTLYAWNKRFMEQGPEGLMDRPRGGRKGSALPELTKRTILMLKEANPGYGCQTLYERWRLAN
jgi:hypothetical protein